MSVLLFALLQAAEPTALNLSLRCQGQYQDFETTAGETSTFKNGKWEKSSVSVTRATMKPGTAKLQIEGSTARLTYPDGKVRQMKDVSADEKQISGSYRTGFGLFTWRMKVDRMTGDIEVRNGSDVALLAACERAPEVTAPKF